MVTPSGWIDGRVFDPGRRPLRGAMIIILSGPDDYAQIAAISDIEGRFSFGPLMPGSYRLQLLAEGCRALERELGVGPLETVGFEVTLTELPA